MCKWALPGLPNLSNIEIFVLEVYQNNWKWLFSAVYKSPNHNDMESLNRTAVTLDYNFQQYDNREF